MSSLAELRRVNCPSEHKFRAFVRQSGEEWEINVSSVRFEMGRLEGRKALSPRQNVRVTAAIGLLIVWTKQYDEHQVPVLAVYVTPAITVRTT